MNYSTPQDHISRKWQEITKRNHQRAHAQLKAEGITFNDPENAWKYKMARQHVRQFRAEGDIRSERVAGADMDEVLFTDQALTEEAERVEEFEHSTAYEGVNDNEVFV